MKLSDIIRILEEIAPPEYAEPDDAIGLQVGDPDQEVRRVIVTVDVTPAVISEAVRTSADLLVAHHPVIDVKYAPLRSVRLDVYPQSLVYRLVNAGTALYVMHTNYDAAKGGINDVLAERLGVVDTKVLEPTYAGKMFKLVTFVPAEAVDAVRDALAEAGAGVIGNYTHCSFQSPGTGTFEPMPGAEPYVGKIGELERTPEFRLEVLVPEGSLHDTISAMVAAHPYEEVAYDVYPLWNKGEEFGLGRYGRLRTPMTFDGLCEMVRDVLEVEDLRVSGDPDASVETVALLGGGAGSRIELAHSKGVDVYVTGDVNHHQFLLAKALGLNVIDATHFRTERPGMIALAPRLHEILSAEDVTVEYVDDVTLGSG
ncbi:MAG TPA: Nif3-like dinuclear metal center hexameric protein [Armatimonadota bacterium]|nr:Nif3-like dinuclear metal center hexameric protein [Armatimonadota bacterium]